MKSIRFFLLSLVVLPFLSMPGGMARAGDASPDPFKTCGAGPTKDIIAIDQLWDAYAHNLDAGAADGVADLFTDDGGYILLYNNRKTRTLDPMGYSPNSSVNGTGEPLAEDARHWATTRSSIF